MHLGPKLRISQKWLWLIKIKEVGQSNRIPSVAGYRLCRLGQGNWKWSAGAALISAHLDGPTSIPVRRTAHRTGLGEPHAGAALVPREPLIRARAAWHPTAARQRTFRDRRLGPIAVI